jgi:D-lactate dehydrogenase
MKITFFEVQEWETDILKKQFPDAQITPEKLDETTVSKYPDTEIISTFIYSTVNKTVLDQLKNLKCVTTRSTGFDHIDVKECQSRGVIVCNVPEYGSNTVAEHTFALLLALTRKIHASLHQALELNFDHNQLTGTDLAGKTIGVVGMGKIGQHVCRIANGFEMKVITTSRTPDEALAQKMGFTYVSADELLAQSDVITLHLPLTPHTQHYINSSNIGKIKKGAYLINTARGGLVETEAVVKGLNEGIFAGVGLDVLEEEQGLSEEVAILGDKTKQQQDYKTLLLDHILMNNPHVIITPHNAFNSKEALLRITYTSIDNINNFMQSSPKNTVEVEA